MARWFWAETREIASEKTMTLATTLLYAFSSLTLFLSGLVWCFLRNEMATSAMCALLAVVCAVLACLERINAQKVARRR
jgi:hypothetical protein